MQLKITTAREGTIAKICWLQGMRDAFEIAMIREAQKLEEFDREQECSKQSSSGSV